MAHKVRVGVKNGKAYANPDRCSIFSDCLVVWVAENGAKSFTVEFPENGSPFSGNYYSGGPGRPAWSGACKVRPKPGERRVFKYTLTVDGIPGNTDVEVNGG